MVRKYFGTLTDKRKLNWNNGEDNPYDVLVEMVEVSSTFYYEKYFHDEIWIDWGSIAKRITGKELLSAMKASAHSKNNLKGVIITENEEYGIIDIEDV